MGAVYAIFGAIVWGYIGAALLCALVALRLPRTWSGKLTALICVVLVFGYWPASSEFASRQRHARRVEVETLRSASCERNVIRPASVRIDQLLLDGSALTGNLTPGAVAAYLRERNLTGLEVDARSMNYSFRIKHFPVHLAEGAVYLAFSVAKEGDPACSMFNEWAGEYPAQRLPPLRYVGLEPGACMAIVPTEAARSRFVAKVSRSRRLTLNDEETNLVELDYVIEDAVSGTAISSALVTATERNNRITPACGTRPQGLDREFFPLGEMLLPSTTARPAIETVHDPAPFATTRVAVSDDIERWRETSAIGRRYSTDNIDQRATVWFERSYTRSTHGSASLSGYVLVSYVGHTIHRTLIRVDDIGLGLPFVTALRATAAEIRFIILDSRRERGWLATYSRSGRPIELLALDRAQLEALGETR